MTSKHAVHFSSKRQDWETPDDLFAELDAEFHFDVDVCAAQYNAKCKKFWAPRHDGLKQRWLGNCWMNPPYGREIVNWLYAAQTATCGWRSDNIQRNAAKLVCCLIPARTDTRWWHSFIWDNKKHIPRPCVEVRFLKGRIKFKGAKHSAPFPSAIVIFRRPA